ncbi:MAG: hypothetical protein H0U52_08025 [Chloroflexi bacterium]|nr:hypothetical protein [Chloroflexota bacterium]
MRRLIGLYPRAWRERYGAEFDDLLDDRPATLRDQLDIAAGAIDAWIHPQIIGHSVVPTAGGPDGGRLLGPAAAIAGGGLLILGGALMFGTRVDAHLGYKLVDAPLVGLVLGMVLVSVAAIARSSRPRRVGSRPASAASVAMLIGAMATALPWPFLAIGLFGFLGASMAFGLIIAVLDRRPAGILIAIATFLMASMNTEDERALLTIPFAIAWMLIGLADLRPAPRATHPGPSVAVDPGRP